MLQGRYLIFAGVIDKNLVLPLDSEQATRFLDEALDIFSGAYPLHSKKIITDFMMGDHTCYKISSKLEILILLFCSFLFLLILVVNVFLKYFQM